MKLKKLTIMLFVLCLGLGFSLLSNTTYAALNSISDEEIELIDGCFNNEYIIYEGNEIITEDFLNDNIEYYNNGDYEEIINTIMSGNYSFLGGLGTTITETPSGRVMYLNASNGFILIHPYQGYTSRIEYKITIKYIDSTADVVSYPSKASATMLVNGGNVADYGTKNSQTPVVTQGAIDKVTYRFGVYVKHTDGTYFDPSEVNVVTVACSQTQPNPTVE